MSTTISNNAVYTNLTNMILNLRVDPNDLGDFAKYYNKFVKEVAPWAQYYRILNCDVTSTYAFPASDGQSGGNILSTNPAIVNEQLVQLDSYRQCYITIEKFRSKAAMGTANMFSDFVSAVTSQVENTFKLWAGSHANVFLGAKCSCKDSSNNEIAKGTQDVTLSTGAATTTDKEALLRLQAGELAQGAQQILDEMKDATRSYNGLGYVRSTSDPFILWDEKYARLLKKGLQGNTLFNSVDFNLDNTMPDRFFKKGVGSQTTGTSKKYHSLIEQDITVGGVSKHFMPGDLLPDNLTGLTAADNYEAGVFGADITENDIACIICDPEYPIILHSETINSEFQNPKNHTQNVYKTWSYGFAEDYGKAFVKVRIHLGDAPTTSVNVKVTNDNDHPVITQEKT